MRAHRLLAAALAVPAWLFLPVDAAARDLTLEDRVRAQEAIDRVYYAHQVDARGRFEVDVPRPILEGKVRAYLKQTVALERRWHVRITSEMLRDELDRMTRDTRMPDRLREIFTVLGNDPFVIQECLVRPVLVERLARERYANDLPRLEPAPTSGSTPSGARAASQDWSEWWRDNARMYDERDVAAVAASGQGLVLPDPEAGLQCLPDQTWDNRSLSEYRVPRTQSASVWTGSLLLMWSGQGPPFAATTGVRYDPATDTYSPMSATGAPSGRSGAAAIWTGSRMIVWGGRTDSGTPLGGGARYEPVSDTWASVSAVNAPEPRLGASVVWTGARMIVWGGLSTLAGDDVDTGLSYDPAGDVWSAISQVGAPDPRDRHTAVWTGTRMLVWGGIGGGLMLDSGGAYDASTDTWSSLSVAGAPSPRLDHEAVWTGHVMVVWGGQDGSGPTATGGRYDPGSDAWTPTTTTNAPTARRTVPPVWTGSRMIVWGGDASSPVDTGGLYDPVADVWTTTSAINAPTGRSNHAMVWTGNRLVVWGGDRDGDALRTGARYDPVADTWTPTSDPGAPAPAYEQSGIWTGNEMIVWGGQPPSSPSANTGGRYDPALDAWRPVSQVNAPSPRVLHTAVWTGSRMVVWGGMRLSDYALRNDGGRYDPIADLWLPMTANGAPAARIYQLSVWTGTLLLVWGGEIGDYTTYLTSGGLYDPAADTWRPMSTVNAPSGRDSAAAVWTGARMIIWGGSAGGTFQDAGGRYDPAADRWEPMSALNAPPGRYGVAAVWTGKAMIAWGGYGPSGTVNTGGLYDPALDRWTPTSTIGAPLPRDFAFALWTGTRMIIWGGGTSNGDTLNSGGIYDPVGSTWVATSLVNAPYPWQEPVVVWARGMMVVYGGYYNNGVGVGTGGRFAYGMLADADHDGVTVCGGDCDDSRPEVHPGAAEICDGLDNDCNGVVDDLPPAACDDGNACTADACGGSLGCLHPPRDRDGDGYGDGLCGGNDCDDLDPLRHPGAAERCNGLDDNCNGVVDEGGDLLCDDHDLCSTVDVCRGALGCSHQARDVDGDGHGDATCGGDDCDDANAGVWFPAIEVASLSAAGSAPTALAWTDQGPLVGPEVYYLLISGAIASSGTSGFTGASCLQVGSTTTSADSRPDPPLGTAYWYLVRTVNECGSGTYGTAQRDAGLSNVCY